MIEQDLIEAEVIYEGDDTSNNDDDGEGNSDIICKCLSCDINLDGVCNLPHVIRINHNGVCEVGLRYLMAKAAPGDIQ